MNISLKAQKRIKIIFCCIVAFPFLISLLNALLFTSGVSNIKVSAKIRASRQE